MGWRRPGRGAAACLLVALVIASAVAPYPARETSARAVAVDPAPGTTRADSGGPVPGGAPGGVAAEDAAIPEYPSAGRSGPLGAPIGPVPTLANAIQNHHFDDAWALGYRGAGVRVAVVDEGVDFGHPDLQGTQAIVSDPASPYVGWPIVYDTKSLYTYLKTGYPDTTWFANTTRIGVGPFDVTHTIKVDGTNDFGDRERVGSDPRDNTAAGAGGDKQDFDLTDLYLTRDDDNWYTGFPLYLQDQNASFTLLFDVDNETSGAYVAPRSTVDTNASHADRVNDVAWSPDGTRLATAGGDRLVRIWDRGGSVLRTMAGHASEPMSVAWSPDGTIVASADKDRIRLWNAASGALIREIRYVPLGDITINENGILAFSPNGTWIAAATFKYVHVFEVATGAKFGSVWPVNWEVNAVAFNGAGDRLAVALGNNEVRVYAVTPGIFDTPVPAAPLYTLAGPSGHTQPVLEVAWSPDGTKIVSGARDDTAKLWDVPTQAVLRTMPDHTSWVLAADWAPSGAYFVTSSRGLAPSVAPSWAVWDASGIRQAYVTQGKAIGGIDWSFLGEVATGAEDLTARLWTTTGTPIRTLVAHRPDFAMYVHGFSRYSDRENKYVHGADLADWYRWDTGLGSWVSSPLYALGGTQAAFQFGEALFNEFAIPRALLGDPSALSVTLFSTHENGSKAQDTVPSDRNVDFRDLDFAPGWSSLSAFAWRRIEAYSVSGLASQSGAFHFGYHPGPSVQRRYGALGILVADPTSPGDYDRVYLDMNDDKVFDATDVAVSKANPIATIDVYNATSGGPGRDGYPDISAGMIYFIADGTNPLPYSSRLAARKAGDLLQVRIPAAGNLVAFAGEFGVEAATATPAEHGTRIASAIVGQGRLPTPLVGTANAARLVGIMNGLYDVVEAWTFAIEGYDANPETGDDQAHVVVSAFNFPTLHHDGWDVYSRTADLLSTHTSNGTATFVASAGDTGFGYGTVLSPASGPAVIAAGRAGDFSLRSNLVGGSEGPNPHFRNPAVPGSRGPTAGGFAKPELLAVDTAALAIPLHSAGDGTTAVTSAPMTGSDVSAAIVAGAAAIVVEAFTARTGRLPRFDEVRAILMSGADDAGHDVLTQGAGFLNASRSAKLALGTADAGLEVSPPTWHPGAYRDRTRQGFTRLVYPGDVWTDPIALRNAGGAPIAANVEAVAYAKIGEYAHTNVTRTDLYQPTGNVALWVNDTGLWKVDGATFTPVRLQAPVPGLWANAELVKVTAVSDLERLTYKVGTTYLVNYSYALKAYDWTIDWANWFPGFGPFPAPAFFMNELNTVGETFHQANALEVRASFPATALHEGLVISLEAPDSALAVDNLPWTFLLEFYDRAPWGWATVAPASLNIAANSTQSVDVTLTVPANAALGSYEAALLVRDATHVLTTTVPVLVNVGARTPSLTFGGDLSSSDLYDNHRLFGGYDRGLLGSNLRRPTLGDWRFYFFEIPEQGIYVAPVGYKVLVRTAWVGYPSDVDTFAFARTGADAASQGDGTWYGAFTLRQAGKSEEMTRPENRTITNGPEEVVAYDLAHGLNVIALRAFQLRGLEIDVRLVSGQAGWVNTPTNVDVATRDLAGRAPFAFLSNLDLPALRASAVGPAQTTAFTDVGIAQDVQSWWNFPAWGEWMSRGSFTYIVDVQKALILEVAIQGKTDVDDLDLGVFRNAAGAPCEWDPALRDPLTGLPGYWKTCDVDPEEYLVVDPAVWNYNADGDADERVKWIAPQDGQYLVKVLGYTVLADPGHFDFQVSVTLDTGTGYQVYEAPKPAEIVNGTTPLPAYSRVPLNMTWDFPPATADDAYGGAVLLGLPNAPGVLVVPVAVLLDRGPPAVTAFKINALDGDLDRATNRTTNDPSPVLVVSVEDLDRGQLVSASARIRLDGLDVTPLATVSILYSTRNNRAGLWEGTIAFAPPALGEGTHTVEASIADRAGNSAVGTFTFLEDRTGPVLSLSGALLQYTRAATYTVTGTTEVGAQVNVRGLWYPVAPDGSFSITVPLLNGTNALAVTAADWFDVDPSGNPLPGNDATIVQTVVRDLLAPSFDRFRTDPGGVTRETEAVVSGIASDLLADSEAGSPLDLIVTVDDGTTNATVPVLADGSFRIAVPLVEGANVITATATDPVGNVGVASLSVTRDTTPPGLQVSLPPATAVTTGTVTVEGTTDAGAFVTVNGFLVPSPGGRFRVNVTLSPGANVLVVQTRDAIGNIAEQRFTVTYQTETGLSLPLVGIVLVVGALAGALIAVLLVRRGVRIPGLARGRPPEEGEAPPEEAEAPEAEPEAIEEISEEAPAEEAPAEEEAEGPAEEPEDPRVAKLRTAYVEGRISKEVYEQNLRRMRGSGGA